MYEWSDISDVAKELLSVVRKTCAAAADAKLMSIRKKYSVKKFGMIAIKAQKQVGVFAQMEQELTSE
jgi:hypothetical protein